jgi:hypothetical protein
MALRHRLSPYGKPNFPLVQKQENIISLLYRIEDMISKKIEVCLERKEQIILYNFLIFKKRNVMNMEVTLPIG